VTQQTAPFGTGPRAVFAKLDNGHRLLIGQFLLGMMFFYGVEQIFINELSGPAARGAATAAFTVGLLLFNVPTGILADKFGRKRCLLSACAVAIISLLIMAVSHSLTIYLLGVMIFGLFISLLNGTAEAFLYDWLAVQSKEKLYAKYQGRNYALYLLGAGVANIFSGVITQLSDVRVTYLLSILPVCIAWVILAGLEEPPRSRREDSDAWYGHLGQVLALFKAKPKMLAFGLQLVVIEVFFLTVAEFGQTYMLSFGISTVALGMFWAIDAVFAAAGRAFAHRVQQYPRQLITLFCVVSASFAIVQHAIGIGLFWLFWGMAEMVGNVAETEVQHETPSNIRATVISVIGFFGNLIGIPLLLAYTAYFKTAGVFAANRIIIAVAIVVLLLTLLVRPPKLLSTEVANSLPPKPTI
jgi:MFS family permease